MAEAILNVLTIPRMASCIALFIMITRETFELMDHLKSQVLQSQKTYQNSNIQVMTAKRYIFWMVQSFRPQLKLLSQSKALW